LASRSEGQREGGKIPASEAGIFFALTTAFTQSRERRISWKMVALFGQLDISPIEFQFA
jgi:hypothetical protein